MPNGAFENISGNHQMGLGKELEPDAQLGGGGIEKRLGGNGA